MKTVILVMLLCIGAFANEDAFFRDEEIGLVIQVPEELKRTWNISNCQTGFNLTVFNTDDEEEDEVYVMAVGKMPAAVGEDFEDFFPALLEELFENYSKAERTYIVDEVCCYVEKLDSLSNDANFSQRYRVHLLIEEVDEAVRLDVQLFQKNGQSCFIAVGGIPFETSDDLDDFSENVFSNVSFVED